MPVGAISEGDKYSINPDMCTECELALMYALQKLLARDNTIRQGLKRKMAVLNESSILFDGDMNGYFSSANASLMRRIASTIFSSEVA